MPNDPEGVTAPEGTELPSEVDTFDPDNSGAVGGDLSSPDSSQKPSDSSESSEDEGSKELRRRLTEMGEELKELRQDQSATLRLINAYPEGEKLRRWMSSGSISDDEQSKVGDAEALKEAATKLVEEGTVDAAVAFADVVARIGGSTAINTIRSSYDPILRKNSENTFESAVDRFMTRKGVPELAEKSGKFWNWLSRAAGNDPVVKEILGGPDTNRMLNHLWLEFTSEYGDPSIEKRKSLELERKKKATLADASSAPATPESSPVLRRMIDKARETGEELSMRDIWDAIERME